MTINRPVEDVYRFWRDLSNLPRCMQHLESVTPLGNGRSHWIAKGPAGMRRVGRRDHQRRRKPRHRLALAGARGRGERGLGQLPRMQRRDRDRWASAMLAAGRTHGRADREAVRRRAVTADSGRPAPREAVPRNGCWRRRSADADATADESAADARERPRRKILDSPGAPRPRPPLQRPLTLPAEATHAAAGAAPRRRPRCRGRPRTTEVCRDSDGVPPGTHSKT